MTDKIIVIKEPLFQSIARDTYSFTTLLAMVGIGIWLNSGVLQFIGGVTFIWFSYVKAINLRGKFSCTIDEARAKLDEWERGE